MARAGRRKVQRYSLEFKLKAVKLKSTERRRGAGGRRRSRDRSVDVSRWRKQAREGVLRGSAARHARRPWQGRARKCSRSNAGWHRIESKPMPWHGKLRRPLHTSNEVRRVFP